MVDVALIKVKAGDGGDGIVHFRREKYVAKGGPDGGDGGKGGSVFLELDSNLRTLDYFAGREKFEATRGRPGRKKKMSGPDGEDITLKVPEGTVVYQINQKSNIKNQNVNENANISKREVVAWLKDKRQGKEVPLVKVGEVGGVEKSKEISRQGKSLARNDEIGEQKRLLVAKGGQGGRGNDRFKSSTNRTPMESEDGEKGEEKWLVLELKLLADVGLVGLPNAGKSTLLSVLTAARPKVAEYPFTTLEPILGVLKFGETAKQRNRQQELVLADIPGLIEGASEGKGLGDEFLRHVERSQVLVHVVGIDINPKSEIRISKQTQNSNDQRSKIKDQNEGVAAQLLEDYQTIRRELLMYHESLASKPEIVVVNKMDLLMNQESRIKNHVSTTFKKNGVEEVLFVSAVTGVGLAGLRDKILRRDV